MFITFAALRRALLLVAVAAATITIAPAGPNTECPQVPPGTAVDFWEPILIGDKMFALGLDYVPGDADSSAAPDATQGRAAIRLLARYLDLETREARSSSLVPDLAPVFNLRIDGASIASGTLTPTITPRGPAYEATVPVSGTDGLVELEIGFDSPGAEPDHEEAHPEHEDPCIFDDVRVDVIGTASLGGLLGGVDLDGAEAGASDNFRMRLVSSLDPRPTDNYSDVWGYFDGATYLAIIGATNGTSFVDVTDAANPVEVGFIAGPSSSWRDIKTYGHFAYITTEGSGTGAGLQVVNLSNPLVPTLATTYAATFTTAHNIYIDTDRGHAYICGSSAGLRVLDVATDPANPVEIGSWTPRYVHDAYVKDGIAYFSEINNGRQEILDATNPVSLTVLASWPTPDGSAHNCWANEDQTLLVVTDEVSAGGNASLWDITQKTAPGSLLSTYEPRNTTSVHNAYFDDDDPARVAMSHYAIGVRYLDVYRPTRPVELGGYDTYPTGDSGFNGAWGVYAYDPRGYLYVSDISNGLFVLDYDPTGGTLSGIVRDASSGAPIADARVVAIADGSTSTTDEDGVYAMYAPAGSTALRVTAAGYSSATVSVGDMPLGGRLDADVALAALPKAPLSGVVRRSDSSALLEGVSVEIAGTTLATTTASDGSFAFPEVAIGQQIVTAEKFGFASAEGRIVLVEGVAGAIDLALEPGVLVDDVESAKGWTLGAPGDSATSGIWTRVDPVGTGGGTVQPEDDHTPAPGVTAFVTGQATVGSSAESNDVDGGPTTLVSPRIDATGMGSALVGYHRWVSNNAGAFSGGRLLVQVSGDDGASWVTLESQAANANAWTRREFDVASFAPLTDRMRVRFRAEPVSPYNFSVLETAVDDFEWVRACGSRFNPAAPDSDRDGSIDGCDRCPGDPDNDGDGDGLCGDGDNAPFVANADQLDADGDGIGNAGDNCPSTPNLDQRDLDRDGQGDACDTDLDGDGVVDTEDADRDADGVLDASDNCASVPNAAQLDTDGDGEGDSCDANDQEVHGVRFETSTRLSWDPELGATGYDVYRGDLGAEGLVRLAACKVSQLAVRYDVDLDLPVPGDGFFYLISGMFAGGEGTLGRTSDGTERLVDATCP